MDEQAMGFAAQLAKLAAATACGLHWTLVSP
jgi:hypothetical protein